MRNLNSLAGALALGVSVLTAGSAAAQCVDLDAAAIDVPFTTTVDADADAVYLSVAGGDTPTPNDCGLNPSNDAAEWQGWGGPLETDNASIGEGAGTRNFVTIGGMGGEPPAQAPGGGAGTGLDPNFGGNTAAYPGDLAGWYNGSPPSLNGAVGETPGGLGVFVGRFSYMGDFSLTDSTLEVTWNQGLGTPGQQAGFIVNIPAPGALALLGLAGLTGRRRRNG